MSLEGFFCGFIQWETQKSNLLNHTDSLGGHVAESERAFTKGAALESIRENSPEPKISRRRWEPMTCGVARCGSTVVCPVPACVCVCLCTMWAHWSKTGGPFCLGVCGPHRYPFLRRDMAHVIRTQTLFLLFFIFYFFILEPPPETAATAEIFCRMKSEPELWSRPTAKTERQKSHAGKAALWFKMTDVVLNFARFFPRSKKTPKKHSR